MLVQFTSYTWKQKQVGSMYTKILSWPLGKVAKGSSTLQFTSFIKKLSKAAMLILKMWTCGYMNVYSIIHDTFSSLFKLGLLLLNQFTLSCHKSYFCLIHKDKLTYTAILKKWPYYWSFLKFTICFETSRVLRKARIQNSTAMT